MQDLHREYLAKRCDFGKQPLYSGHMTQLLDTIPPNMVEARHYILRNPVHQPTQNTTCFSENAINTVRVEYTDCGANHAEGGWPKDVNINDPEATQRYRRRLEKDDAYINCVMKNAGDLEHYVFQNNAIDMYQTYYTELDKLTRQELGECRTVNVYRDDPQNNGRPISSICWRPDGGQHFAVSYLLVDFYRNTQSSVHASIWDVENSNSPFTKLWPPCPMLDLQYNPKEQNMLASALINGQVAAFDVRTPHAPSHLCPVHVAHRDAVHNVLFSGSKTGMEFFSAGTDGGIKWWDLRNFSEPIEELCLDMVKANEEQSMSRAKGVSVLEFEPTMPTRFMVGTEDGAVMCGNRKGKTIVEKIPTKFNVHVGPVWSLQRNPNFMKNFLTVGDWTARVWTEECRESAIFWTAWDRHCITDGTWSPTRLSLMLLTKANGMLTVWDLVKRQNEPVVTVQVCEEPLAKVAVHEAMSAEDVLCQECYILLEGASLNLSSGSTAVRAYGHEHVCFVCGSSILRAKTHKVSIDSPEGNVIMACIPTQQGALLTCGSRRGSVYLLELSSNLTTVGKNDKMYMTQVLEREAKRERILEARIREIKLKHRQAEEASPAASLTSAEGMTGDADLDAATAEYHAVIKKELTSF